MDGVDLDIEIGSHKYYPDFVREMRRLMNTDKSKQYLITAAPQCPFPDRWMGPQIQGSALEGVFLDCWQSFFLSKFSRGYEERCLSLKGNGTRHGHNAVSPSSLLGHGDTAL